MKSYIAKPADVKRDWYVVDAEGKTLGRLATEIATILRGKNKPTFTPHVDGGDFVIVVNAEKVVLTGKKLTQKYYRYHTGYVGGLKEISYKEMMEKKWPQAKYIGYFQAFTNTYAPLEVLKEKYEIILDQEGVIGLSISTRPDCIDDHILDYLDDLNKRTNLWVELGLQTVHDKTSNIINRGHGLDIFIDCVNRLRSRGIEVVAHVINGLPGESHDMMMETISRVAQMNIQGVKIHLLHVIKGTPMVNMLNRGDLKLLTKEEYVNLVCDQLEILPQEMIIHRLTGDGKKEDLVGPMWSLKKWEVLNAIDDELKRRDSWQGKFYTKNVQK